MPSMRKIHSRIEGIKKTKQITNSMRLVASSKVQKSRLHMENNFEHYTHMIKMMEFLSKNFSAINSRFFYRGERPETEKSTVIIISTDRGLCGGFNASVSRESIRLIKKIKNENVHIISLGGKVENSIIRAGFEVKTKYLGLSETPLYEEASMVGEQVLDLYDKGFQNVYIVYTRFISVLEQLAVSEKILPFKPADLGESDKYFDAESSPSMSDLLRIVVKQFVSAAVYDGMVKSAASEQSARMTSMDSASRNSEDIIDALSMRYNQMRQDKITQEITEIASGASVVSQED